MNDIVKVGLRLLLITTVAALVLSVTYVVTEDAIAQQVEQTNKAARKAVLNAADDFKQIDVDEDKYPDIIEIFEGYSNDVFAGYIFKVVSKGYGGAIEVLVGINSENSIEAIEILSHNETPGLGAKAAEPGFKSQFKGKDATSPVKKDGISAVTGATITSDAVREAVNTAIEFLNNELQKEGTLQ